MYTMESRLPGQAATTAQIPYMREAHLLPLFDSSSIVLPGPPLFGVSVDTLSGVSGTVVYGAGILALAGLAWYGVHRLMNRSRSPRWRKVGHKRFREVGRSPQHRAHKRYARGSW